MHMTTYVFFVGRNFHSIPFCDDVVMRFVETEGTRVLCDCSFRVDPNLLRSVHYCMVDKITPSTFSLAKNVVIFHGSASDFEENVKCVDNVVIIRNVCVDGQGERVPNEFKEFRTESIRVSDGMFVVRSLVKKNVSNEDVYLDLLKDIMASGVPREERTGVGTIQVYGRSLEFDMRRGFPILTTKRMFTKGILEELFMFLKGETNTKCLEAKGVNIWKGNTSREFLDSRGLHDLPEGNMGKGYGYQWRHWGSDQIHTLLREIDANPTSRRHIVSAWNVSDLDEMALPPCHIMFQINVDNEYMDLHMYQRSADVFLGLPFNIASYAFLLSMIARTKNKTPRNLRISVGDCHVYANHIQCCMEQLSRTQMDPPVLVLAPKSDIMEYTVDDFKLINYQCHDAIKATMAI